LNPNTRTCPVFRSRRDAGLTQAIYRSVPVLLKEGPPEENPWGITMRRMFDMDNHHGQFRWYRELVEDGYELVDGNQFVRGATRYLPGRRFLFGEAGIATKMRYAFGLPRQGFQRRPMPDAMPPRQPTRR